MFSRKIISLTLTVVASSYAGRRLRHEFWCFLLKPYIMASLGRARAC